MALGVTHAKTNAVADWTQSQLNAQIAAGNFAPGTTLAQITLPSDWNAAHSLSGTLDTAQITNNAVTNAKFRQSIALSVVGRNVNSIGNVDDINAISGSGDVLRESGGTLGFGNISASVIDGLGALAFQNEVELSYQITGILGYDHGGTGTDGSGYSNFSFFYWDPNTSQFKTNSSIRIDDSERTLLITDDSGDPRIWMGRNPSGMNMPTAGMCCEVGTQLVEFGTNFDQLGGYTDHDNFRGAFFRIDTRDGIAETDLLSLYVVEIGSGENAIFGIGNTGDVHMSGSITSAVGAAFSGNVTVADQAFGASWDGSVQVPTKNAIYDMALANPVILKTTTGINGKTVANTNVYTVPTGKTAFVIGYNVRCTAASAITIGPSAGLGNASGTNNIAASQAMTALLTTADYFNFPIIGMSKTVTAGNSVFFNLGTAATGTSQTLAVDVIGYLV